MTEGRLRNLEIRKAKRHEETDHIVLDVGSARLHVTLSEQQAAAVVHDGHRQASILLDANEEITTVTHEEDVSVVDRTGSLVDPLATTSRD
jgi:hypothetical protein